MTYLIPVQTYPRINIQVVMDTFNMLTGSRYNNVNFVICKVRDPFTKDVIVVKGSDGLESTVHFVLINKAYERFLKQDHTSVWKPIWKAACSDIYKKIHKRVNRFIGFTRKNERF